MRWEGLIAGVILVLVSVNAHAIKCDSSEQAKDGRIKQGDAIRLNGNANLVQQDTGNKVTGTRGMRFEVTCVDSSGANVITIYLTADPEKDCNVFLLGGLLPNSLCLGDSTKYPAAAAKEDEKEKSDKKANADVVKPGERYQITQTDLNTVAYVRRGFSSGVLVIPYKYVIATHDLAQGSVTIGPYVGYTTNVGGSEFTFALSAGLSTVAVPNVDSNGNASSTTKSGLSVAAGMIFSPFGGSAKAGFMFGVDQLGKNSQYDNNGKLWIGLYVGAGFN